MATPDLTTWSISSWLGGLGAVAEQALAEKAGKAEFRELIGCKLDIGDLEQAAFDRGIEERHQLVMAAFRAAFVKPRAELGDPLADADHRALRLDHLVRRDLERQHLAEADQRLAQVVGAAPACRRDSLKIAPRSSSISASNSSSLLAK